MALSALCRRRGDPEEVRRAIGRAQCNDASWHGVFGGLYLPHLREAVWLNLAHAERALRSDEKLAAQVLDFDADGSDEVWVHSAHFSVVVAPARGGAVVEYTIFEDGVNYADVLTRRREAYHDEALAQAAHKDTAHKPDDHGMASIHDLEHAMTLVERPAIDLDDRAFFVDRILSSDVTAERHARADYAPVKSWARSRLHFDVIDDKDGVEIVCTGNGIEKRIRFSENGEIVVSWIWNPSAFEADARFASEISLFRPLDIVSNPPALTWTSPVETVSKSEKGLDRTVQGESVTLLWNAALGGASLRVNLRTVDR
jgi:hypothetical protein